MPQELSCPKCKLVIKPARGPAELMLVCPQTNEISAVQRTFRERCPDCGPMYIQAPHMGHHSTHQEKVMRQRFGKHLSKIKPLLPESERKPFEMAWKGKSYTTKEQVQLWERLLSGQSDSDKPQP